MISTILLSLAASTLDPIEVTIPGPEGDLAGTLVQPDEDGPAMILIPGSGPTDRNGDNPMGVKGKMYRQLADGLAAQGISTLLIDKRGMFGSADAVPNANAVTFGDYVTDVRGWMGLLEERGAECVWLAGHSEGSTVALLAAQDATGICGLVLISGAGSAILDIMRGQLARQLPPAMLESIDTAFAELKAGRTFDPEILPGPLHAMFGEDLQRFMISGYTLDPVGLLSNVDLPVIIVQGEEDLQVAVSEAEKLHAAAPESTLVLLDRVNHALKPVEPGEMAANVASYGDEGLAIDPRVAEMIAGYINAER
ncbi:alpha/beta hydrolase [Sphingomicrobium clamense]|uniref:Lysophospholipase n=1 Tax=Sphingomicrobium clamense TaxID=2851013 RepID=A0ABS6V2T8_9SPHN|nr:alpha/beta fold hydrolase [Sphingomicrobium sp. B8]MBW0143844.1 lysophospholipase [Sphingomicrobium sp. B8]